MNYKMDGKEEENELFMMVQEYENNDEYLLKGICTHSLTKSACSLYAL